MTVPTWSQLTFLTAPQQASAAQFEAIGIAIKGGNSNPNITGLTYSQAKAAAKFLKDLATLTDAAALGAGFVRAKRQQENADAFEAANP